MQTMSLMQATERFETGLLEKLAEAAGDLRLTTNWPAEQFEWLSDAGVLGWVIPREYGGAEWSQADVIEGYLQLATSCLTTTFVLTQRNGACQRIVGCEDEELKADLLPRLASGEISATVGISHLTTSRQHLKRPVVQAEIGQDIVELNGAVPWVTGAPAADYVVTGGTTGDGRQILIALPMDLEGVEVQAPAELMALNASQTASINLNEVRVPRRYLIAGPVEGVMTRGQGGGAGSVATSSLAVGLSLRSIRYLESESETRGDLLDVVRPLRLEVDELCADIAAAAVGSGSAGEDRLSAPAIRQRSNSLVLRATQAHLAATKGAGFVVGHPAEQAVREAMFFLVWSCPQPVLQAALREFACLGIE